MGVTFSGTKVPQSELAEIQLELYQDSGTFVDRVIDIQENHKSGTDVYESKVAVTFAAASTGAVTATGDIDFEINKTAVNLGRIQAADIIEHSTLLDTRFEKSMQAGAFNLVSSEADNILLQQITPAMSEGIESIIWNGATTETKAAIAALVAAAPQGSISAGAKTLVAAMPTTLVDSLPATILYNYSQSKTVPGAGLGDYKKVLSIAAVTSATIAAEYSKLFLAGDNKVLNNRTTPAMIFAPLEDRQLIKIANNAVGAAQQINFLVEGSGVNEKISYNGVEIKFVPLVGFRILTLPKYLKVLMDLISDVSSLETGQVANGAQQMWYKNVQAFATWVTNQRYITLYGG